MESPPLSLTVLARDRTRHQINCDRGATLRDVLLENKLGPNRGLNCSGFGLCGTCLVEITEGGTKRRERACQIRCFRNLEIELVS